MAPRELSATMVRLQQLDIANVPAAEDERFEYKSSATPLNTLKDKLARAASGFWNSGGGLFIVGVDGKGVPDGGLASVVGRTAIRDRMDQVLKDVSPIGIYGIRLFPHDPTSALNIAANHCVVAVEFEESARPPHMAPDQKYYIRAGAHTVSASHYIVEALWAKRRIQRPQLAHTMRLKPEASDIVQLAILAMTGEPAANVRVSLDPLPEMWKDVRTVFPLRLPVLDRTTPFYLDVTTYFAGEERLGSAVQLRVEYEDLAGNPYDYTATLDLKSIVPWRMGTPATEKTARSLESIDKTLKEIPKALHALQDENAQLRGHPEAIKSVVFSQRIGTASEIAARLSRDAMAVLRAAKGEGTVIYSPFFGGSQLYAGKRQFVSRPDDHREAAKWTGVVSELRNMGLIDGVLERGASSVFRFTQFGYEVADAIPVPGDEPEAAGHAVTSPA
jgi:hypothetical protein